ncbi:sulfotransferase family 2 domain-containing protein [Yeosuana sp. MJ-SS3]|uniref:Sulfotransferase family 2 domain-containing protein n=1 Tax=Gilvirhabdus luticola TaxID=3079858 RepID=A0ABU3U4Z2_9FLAO|nr:sulfotransferase family 2 domain-containing protein [Yeosuana sp. MJ-SS3]MDU8885473.1 sulfotransferase family 2 domain-containing protein [Yeosuana sp. MJ-SS3]
MISHKYKCIFIHIPRTAGSSIEKWICGSDWWKIDKQTKHLLASQAKSIYQEYWDSYFKFSFVRNPWDRSVSCLKHPEYFGILFDKRMNFNLYKERFKFPILVEYDYRFYQAKDIVNNRHKENMVYQNILDKEIDFIGTYENLEKDLNFIKRELGIKDKFEIKKSLEKSNNRLAYQKYYDQKSIEEVNSLYKEDILKFNYSFDNIFK